MRVIVVGAGPTGLFTAMALARRGHGVTVVDRDTGPEHDGSWSRRGVMQFHHPHAFRAQVVEALQAELPEVWCDLLAAGAQPMEVPTGPNGSDGPQLVMGIRCRRLTFERVLRAAAEREPGVVLRVGHVDDVCTDRGRATGVRVDGVPLDADLVVAASGRAGRLGRDLRAPAQGGDCGIAYVSRQYRLNPGAEPGPMNSPLGQIDHYPGYQVIVFLHDHGIFSTLIARSSDDGALAALRTTEAFEAAARAIPALADWTDPARARPHTPVLPGARLHNTYQGQLDDDRRRRPARADLRRGQRVHHEPRGRTGCHHLAAAGAANCCGSSRNTPTTSPPPPWPSTGGAPTTSRPGTTTTSHGTPTWPADGPAATSTSAGRCRRT